MRVLYCKLRKLEEILLNSFTQIGELGLKMSRYGKIPIDDIREQNQKVLNVVSVGFLLNSYGEEKVK